MIDDVLVELRAAGEVDSEGEFTLDRAKAREKLQRFQLADPRRYVLELVQAAALKGATWATFTVDSRDMVMELDGRSFTTADFDDIYGAALTRRLDTDVLARRQLAIGLGSAMALRPRFIAVESGDGTTGARLRLRPDEEDAFEAIETTRVGTRIHVRERFTMGTFAAVFKNLAGTLAEEQLLRERCTYASFGIGLEGTRLDRGLTLEDQEVLEAVELAGEHLRGRCGLRQDGSAPATVRIIKDGVWIVDHELPTDRFPGSFVAIVQDHALRKDVSQADIVRDAAYEALVAVLEQAGRRALADLAERALAGSAPPWAERELMRQVHLLAIRGTLRIVEEPTGLVRALRGLPLWRTTEGRPLCLDELSAEVERAGSIAVTSASAFRGVVLPDRAFVVLLPAAPADPRQAILTAQFGVFLHDVTTRLEAHVGREQARKAWLARPTAPVLPEGAYQCRRAFEGPGVRGELGIVAERTDRSSLVLVVDGCLLVEQPLSVPWLGLRMVVAAESLRPNPSFDGVVPTPAACTAILHAATEIPALYGALAERPASPWRDACAMSFLESALRGDSLALVLGRAFAPPGQPDEGRTAAIEALGRERLVLDHGLGSDAPHPSVDMPLYRMLDPRRRASLRHIVERARRGQPIVAVAEPKKEHFEAEIFVLDEEDRTLIQPLLSRPIADGARELVRLAHEREFLARPVARIELDALAPAEVVRIEGEGITGALRVVPRPGTGLRTIQVLHRQRALDTLQLVMVGEVSGWVECTAVTPTVDYGYVKQDTALHPARAAVLRAFAFACLRIAERARAGATQEVRRFLLEVLALPFPGAMRAAFDNLRQDPGSSMQLAAEVHEQLYAELHVQRTAGDVEDRVSRLARSKTPLSDAGAKRPLSRVTDWALAAVAVLFPPGADPHDLPSRVLRPAAPLAELPLLRHHDGRPLTLATIRETIDRGQTLAYVQGAPVTVDVPDRTIALVDTEQLELLRRVVGNGRVIDGTAIIEQILRRQQLDARAKVERVALAPGAALVSVSLGDGRGPRLEGEVGLPAQHHGDPHRRARMRLWAHVERAPIEVIELDDRPVHVVAAVSDDRLLLSSDHQAVVRNEALDALVAECEACVPALVVQLASRWDRLDPAVRRGAWYHVLDVLVARGSPSLERWVRVGITDEAFAKAAAVPGFIGAGGVPLSAEELVHALQRHHRIEVLPAPHTMWGESPLPPDRPVVCVDAYELAAVRRLFPWVERVEAQWPAWQERARNRRAAPDRRVLPHEACLVVQEVVMHELEGRLAIPVTGHPLTIELCAEGKVIAARALEGVLPCWGSISGTKVRPDDRWADAIVREETLEPLRLRSYKLYAKLARWFGAHEEHPEHPRVAALLCEPLVALRRAERTGPLPDPQARLLDALRWPRVLRLANGRRINLYKALEERPGELAHLELWDAPGQRLQRRYADAKPNAEVARSAAVAPAPRPSAATPPTPAPVAAPAAAPAPTPKPSAPPASAPPSAASTPVPPSPTPSPTPQPAAPAPREPTPEERLVDALRAELGLVRARNEALLSNEHLDRIHVGPLSGGAGGLVARADRQGVIVNRDHPVVQRALVAHASDPVWGSYVASTIYTALNVQLAEITDADERTFLELHAGLVAGR